VSLAPSRLEHGHAFDLATAGWDDSPALAVVSTAEFVDLALARAWGGVTLWCEDAATLTHARARLDGGYLPAAARGASGAWQASERSKGSTKTRPRHALWAAPQAATWEATLSAIEESVASDGQLAVLRVTPAGARLRPLRRAPAAGEPASAIRPLRARLLKEGWHVDPDVPFGGITGMLWAIAARLVLLARRPDIADRAERAHHGAVPAAFLGSFVLTRARRGAHAAVDAGR
jgi:hypothetical protein